MSPIFAFITLHVVLRRGSSISSNIVFNGDAIFFLLMKGIFEHYVDQVNVEISS
jgi:hypothetical protein